ncbi:hypothetical protein OH720_29365 [Pseudomonas sp. WJP1]|uniref:hypothetical protein n=1 Tax=Pseudomonas sp. WJP1 TaxID=2986947 RepID=UPI00234A5B0F|nr:hypothetical protein [Pseudomonas sp. WJP1]WCM54629.1 hypothetical protein OH720_29365 [Pseudomonas sp. WJP1]
MAFIDDIAMPFEKLLRAKLRGAKAVQTTPTNSITKTTSSPATEIISQTKTKNSVGNQPKTPDWKKNGFNSPSDYKAYVKNLPTLDSKGQPKKPLTNTTPGTSAQSNIKDQIESRPSNAWANRQLIKLDEATLEARHSHNESRVIHYENKLIRAGFEPPSH